MSNIAGKAYAMNILTPISRYRAWINKSIFWLAPILPKRAFLGLITLSMIHYARWTILNDSSFPRLSADQPREKLNYRYMLFFSNFNGSWTQYVDSFSIAIPTGLNLLWFKNIGWPNSVPETAFNNYVIRNQIWTEHYYNAYPLATSNDVKSAQRVKSALITLSSSLTTTTTPDAFYKQYLKTLLDLQHDLSQMEPTPVVSLADEAIEKRKQINLNKMAQKG